MEIWHGQCLVLGAGIRLFETRKVERIMNTDTDMSFEGPVEGRGADETADAGAPVLHVSAAQLFAAWQRTAAAAGSMRALLSAELEACFDDADVIADADGVREADEIAESLELLYASAPPDAGMVDPAVAAKARNVWAASKRNTLAQAGKDCGFEIAFSFKSDKLAPGKIRAKVSFKIAESREAQTVTVRSVLEASLNALSKASKIVGATAAELAAIETVRIAVLTAAETLSAQQDYKL